MNVVSPDIVAELCGVLVQEYGTPRHGNPSKALDDLIYVLLSNRSTAAIAAATYRRLRRTYPTWGGVVTAPLVAIRTILRPCGLQRIRARQLRALLRKVHAHFGSYSLEALHSQTIDDAQTLLESLPGVSTKVAKCVQMYALQRPVLPVDVHVFRISKRLGLLAKTRAALSHVALEKIIPSELRYSYHVTCIAHGRLICRAEPRCDACCVRSFCAWGGQHA